ncbi:MAG: DUF4383 domain-containing protein [Gemmatimonas sp.]
MNRTQGIAAPYALIAGAFYLADGIWGFFSPITFGVLSTNLLHTIIHTAMGVLGIYAARATGARLWCIGVGLIVLPVGALYFVPAVNGLLVSLFNLNRTVSIMNIVLGVVSLLMAQMSPKTSRI